MDPISIYNLKCYLALNEGYNPREKICGFHVHPELPIEDFPAVLVIQQHCAEFLKNQGILIDAQDAIKSGYGPHLDYIPELDLRFFF